MPEHRTEPESSNLNLRNILFAIFKWKRIILGFALLGIVAAAGIYFFYPAVYESDARLLVRYVLERSGVDPVDAISGQGGKSGTGISSDGVIAAEVSILTSWDLSVQVAEVLGPNRVLPGVKAPTVVGAAAAINSGLATTTAKGSNIIGVSYQNGRPEVATAVLNELVSRYFTKHLEVHRSAGAFDFVSQQSDQIRARLNQTEDALKVLKAKAGVMSLQDSMTSLGTQSSHLEEQLRAAENDLAEQQARVKQIERGGLPVDLTETNATKDNTKDNTPTPPVQASTKDTGDYQALVTNLTKLRETELEMSAKYTPENVLVKMNQAHINDLENQKRNLEKKFPELATLRTASGQLDIRTERARLAGMKSKLDDLRRQKIELQDRMKQLADIGPQIASLERNKDLEEQNYKYYSGTLQKARVDEALDPSKMPNISAIQRPSPPGIVTKTRNKIALGLAGGGLASGICLALLFELVFNHSYKRRSEVELQLRSPVMLSIPYQGIKKAVNGRRRLPWKNGQRAAKETPDQSKASLAPWEVDHFIRPYSEAIRDRLGLYFELHGVTHKPKLIGVTGFGEGAGTSTLAAGVAAALSETGDGKVLLVDVNAANGDVHPFFAGRPAAALTTAIKPQAAITSTADNLYLATITRSGNNKSTHLGLKKFFALVPNLKASDFDYIIFDMPPINQTSPTIGLAALMDKVLVVVEAEKTHRDVVKRGYRELVGARADVAVVLNKTRSYGPNWLEGDS